MLIEYCPIHGPLVITTKSSLSRAELARARHLHVLEKSSTMANDSCLVTPLPEAFMLLKQAARTLKEMNPHGPQTALTGIPTDQLAKLEVVTALVEQRQRSIENDDLQSRAELDKQCTLSRVGRLQPVVRKAAQGKADAEFVMHTIRAEPDQLLALNTLRHLMTRTSDLSMGDVDVVVGDQALGCSPDFVASKAYLVQLSVSSINADTSIVSCMLQGGQDLEPIFQASDLGHRSLLFHLSRDRLVFFGYCMLLGLQLKAQISIRIALTAKGPSYRCSLITIQDEETLLASIRKAIATQTPDLFS